MSERILPQRWVEPGPVAVVQSPTVARGSTEQTDESPLKIALDLLALTRRNLALVLLITLGALGIALFLARNVRPIYRATATIRFDDKSRNLSAGIGGGPVQKIGGPVTDPLLTQIQVMQSRAVAREIVTREPLLRVVANAPVPIDRWLRDISLPDSTFAGKVAVKFDTGRYVARLGGDSASARYGESVALRGAHFMVLQKPKLDRTEVTLLSREAAANDVMGALHGRPRDRTDIIDVTFDSPDSAVAIRGANTAVLVFQDMNARTTKGESVRRRRFIDEQLNRTDILLSEAEGAHNRFRRRENVFSSQDKFRAQQADVTGIQLRRQELSADRSIYVSLLDALQDPRRTTTTAERLGALVASPGIAGNAVVTQLYAQLSRLQATRDSLMSGPYAASTRSPEVERIDALIPATEAKIVTAVRAQITAADARLAALDELKRTTSGEMAALPTTEAEEANLLAQVGMYRRESERLHEELQKAQIEEAAQAGQIDVVDEAVGAGPVGGGSTPRIVFTLIMGFAAGVLLAYVRENYSAVVRRQEDIERLTGVSVLVVVPPFLDTKRARRGVSRALKSGSVVKDGSASAPGELVVVADNRSHAAEAFRTLRTNLTFSSGVRAMRHFIVTSAGPGEGKSTVAANTAAAFAKQGKRVLLIDCDLRKPRQHKVFNCAQVPGLTNVLTGLPLAEAIHRTETEGLTVLAAGPTPPNPVELLGSTRMVELLDKLAGDYDVIFLDTPPVLVASDAALLSRYADATLLVVRAGTTKIRGLRDTIQGLRAVGTTVLGTIINDPDGDLAKFSSSYGYYYSSAYYEYAAAES